MKRFPTLLCLLFSLAPVFPKENLSQPDYRGRLQVEYLRVPMRDGVELAAKVGRPDAEGRFPGVMMYYPYRFLRKAPTTTVRLVQGAKESGSLLGSSFTVSSKDPANAVLKARAIRTVNRPESRIQVEANETTSSDALSFRHLVQVEILVNGKRHFQKSWSVTVPRKLN